MKSPSACDAANELRELRVRLVFERIGVLVAAGLALRMAGSLWATRFVEALLFRLEPRDPVTFGGAAGVLVAVGILAA